MKKFLVLCIGMLMACTVTVNAQSKGDMYLGGNLSLGVSTTGIKNFDSETTVGFGIAPEFGYFFANKWKVGMGISYYVQEETHTMSFMPNIAYYVPIVKNLYYVPEFAIGGGFVAANGETEGMFQLSLNLASLEYRPTQKMSFGVGLVNLNYMKFGDAYNVNFGILTSPTVSFKYFF